MTDCDIVPSISSIPGPRGATGPTGAAAAAAVAGKSSFTVTTASFVMPAASAGVVVAVADTSWMSVGQPIFVTSAGQFVVASIASAVSVTLTAQNVPTNAAATTVVATAKKVSPGGIAYIDSSTYTALAGRVTVLETAPGGIRTYFGSTAPAGTHVVGDLWFETASGNPIAQWRWDGSGWVKANTAITLADFGTGIKPIVKVDALVGAGAVGDFVLLTTDNKLYRGTGSGWTKAMATGDLTGQVDANTILIDGTVIAQKIGANAITAVKVGANQIITQAANIGAAVITDAHITTLAAGKITAGDIQSVNIGYAGRIFHPTYSANKFRSVDFGTSFADAKVFAAGNCLSAVYVHATPVTGYGPGNAGWTSGVVTACPDGDGKVRVQAQGRLINYSGNILIYCQINSGTPFALSARNSSDGSSGAVIDCMRILTGIAATDTVKVFVAPASGDGTITATTCRFEIDVTFFNW